MVHVLCILIVHSIILCPTNKNRTFIMIVFQHLICVVPERDFFTSCEAREIAPRNSEGLTHLHELQMQMYILYDIFMLWSTLASCGVLLQSINTLSLHSILTTGSVEYCLLWPQFQSYKLFTTKQGKQVSFIFKAAEIWDTCVSSLWHLKLQFTLFLVVEWFLDLWKCKLEQNRV